ACPAPLGGIFDKRDFASSTGHPFLSAKKDAKNRRSPSPTHDPAPFLGLRGQPAVVVKASAMKNRLEHLTPTTPLLS
ncbi:MAG: hypothetical protein AAF399_11095, partial [Bacteroidota bacterium]